MAVCYSMALISPPVANPPPAWQVFIQSSCENFMNSVGPLHRLTTIALAVALLSTVAACGKKSDAAANSAPPPAEVSVISIAPERLALTTELPGRLEATRIAEVRARAAGIVQKRTFREGSDVKAGE